MDAGWIVVIVLAMFYVVPSLMILFSLMAIVWPRAAWYAREGWKFRGAEPSSLALVMTRIGGFFGCVFGIVFLVVVMQRDAGEVRARSAGRRTRPGSAGTGPEVIVWPGPLLTVSIIDDYNG